MMSLLVVNASGTLEGRIARIWGGEIPRVLRLAHATSLDAGMAQPRAGLNKPPMQGAINAAGTPLEPRGMPRKLPAMTATKEPPPEDLQNGRLPTWSRTPRRPPRAAGRAVPWGTTGLQRRAQFMGGTIRLGRGRLTSPAKAWRTTWLASLQFEGPSRSLGRVPRTARDARNRGLMNVMPIYAGPWRRTRSASPRSAIRPPAAATDLQPRTASTPFAGALRPGPAGVKTIGTDAQQQPRPKRVPRRRRATCHGEMNSVIKSTSCTLPTELAMPQLAWTTKDEPQGICGPTSLLWPPTIWVLARDGQTPRQTLRMRPAARRGMALNC
jgi:hypothetical protein